MSQIITQDSTQIWAGFRALSDPLRIQIIELLRSTRTLCVRIMRTA